MIKVYIDWNVMAQMKNGHHPELLAILDNNPNLLKPYSTSHISDILSSFKEDDEQKLLIQQDLIFISKLTNNAFLFNTSNDIILEFSDPREYYEDRLSEKGLYEDLSIDGLFSQVPDDEVYGDAIKVFVSMLKKLPLDNMFKEAFDNPEAAEKMEVLFPGLKNNLTMDGLFKSFSEMQKNLNEGDGYKELRNIVQSGLGINRKKIFDNSNPYEYIQNSYKRAGNLSFKYHTDDKNAPLWFNIISNEYLQLDMHGYQEDKVNINKGR